MLAFTARLEESAVEALCVVAVAGEVDPATIGCVSRFIAANCPRRCSVELDLSDVTFTDCSLIRFLESEQQDRASHHAIIRVVRPSQPVRRLLELTDCRNFMVRQEAVAGVGVICGERHQGASAAALQAPGART